MKRWMFKLALFLFLEWQEKGTGVLCRKPLNDHNGQEGSEVMGDALDMHLMRCVPVSTRKQPRFRGYRLGRRTRCHYRRVR